MESIYNRLKITALLLLLVTSCNGQGKQTDTANKIQRGARVGGPCETCELMYEGMPDNINNTDTSAAWGSHGQRLVVTGTVYKQDKKTPAPGIILYYWQTDTEGVYADKDGLDPKVRRHGYLRGWVKTDAQGTYSIYTVRPGSYPNSKNPQHIHMLVKEAHLPNEYYIDDVHFEDDPLLTEQIKQQLENKGASGVVKPTKTNGVQHVRRDIILGLNVTDYPGN